MVGDPPAAGGQILPYVGPEYSIRGRQAALIGGRAFCRGCNSIGIIAKAGGPRRSTLHNAEIALEADVVVCHCPMPQPLIAKFQGTEDFAIYEDMGGAIDIPFKLEMLTLAWLGGNEGEKALAARKIVDEGGFQHAPEHEPTLEAICPNITNKEFSSQILRLRDEAILLARERLAELDRWDKRSQARVLDWFGQANQDVRAYRQKGIIACVAVLKGLAPANFFRYAEGHAKHLGCTFPSNADDGTVAAVCKPDIANRTIAIAPRFCQLPENHVRFGTKDILFKDTKLSTLVHEVTHFNDTFGSSDDWYGMKNSHNAVKGASPKALLKNADSLASYIVGAVED